MTLSPPREYRCRHVHREHHYALPCQRTAVVVWRDPATGFVHPRCGYHRRAVESHARLRGWVTA